MRMNGGEHIVYWLSLWRLGSGEAILDRKVVQTRYAITGKRGMTGYQMLRLGLVAACSA